MAIAIGDIHGCLETLKALIARLPETGELIFLGDYIDRGPDSADVVKYLKSLAAQRPCRFLMGNHEDMMLNAVRNVENIPMWLLNGGEQTLLSYGECPARHGRNARTGARFCKAIWISSKPLRIMLRMRAQSMYMPA